jgi:3-dehydroquinate synthase
MGTGKTTNGRRLAERLGLPFVDTDQIVVDLAGKSIPEIFAQDGEERFRGLETRALEAVLEGPRAVVATGGGIMGREQNVRLMKSGGPIVCLQASPETILRRTAGRSDRPLLRGPDPLATIRRLLQERQAQYAQADYWVSTDGGDRDQVLEEMMRLLAADERAALLVRKHVRVPVTAGNQRYLIHIAPWAFARLGRLCPPPRQGVRCAVVTAESVGRIYAAAVREALTAAGWEPTVVTVPDGEAAKTLDMASHLYDRLVAAGVDGAGCVFALGGGVIGDLAGFVAATYRRGIRFAQLPTTLLAQVDAAVGGKVAVDHPAGKNLIGTFYQPAAVVIDSDTLRTLPARELRCGLAEVIKHALIADAELFEYLERELEAFLNLEPLAVRYVLARNCQIKAEVVAQDPLDRGVRACLNFGHTIGHALERAAGEWALRHGEAVAIGMVAETGLAESQGVCASGTKERLVCLLERANLPVAAPGIDLDVARAALLQDKKILAGTLRLPVVTGIGSVRILEGVPPEQLLRSLQEAVGAA